MLEEKKNIGLQNVTHDDFCNVYGTIPSTLPNGGGISIGFLGHMDTAPDASGTDVKPWVLENYPGGDIVLNKEQNIVMEAAKYPRLAMYVGQDLILTDGTTLLGGDDKAAITSIMTMAEYFCRHPSFLTAQSRLDSPAMKRSVFWGAHKFDIERFGADIAYTLDGDGLGRFYL